jgi:hypothetical protein
MRYKQLVSRKLEELQNLINVQSSMVSQMRPPEEMKDHLDKIKNKLQEVQVLINTEYETY